MKPRRRLSLYDTLGPTPLSVREIILKRRRNSIGPVVGAYFPIEITSNLFEPVSRLLLSLGEAERNPSIGVDNIISRSNGLIMLLAGCRVVISGYPDTRPSPVAQRTTRREAYEIRLPPFLDL